MALVRGASSFWLKETVSTVWDSFFMGRYPDGSNEAFLLTTHLLKIPNHHQVSVEECGCVPFAIKPMKVIFFLKSKKKLWIKAHASHHLYMCSC